MKTKYLVVFLFIALMTASLQAAVVYYVDASGGSDSNTGLSPSSPWKTINKVSKTSFLPGDSILLKRGEAWNETMTVPVGGISGAPITLASYGIGAKPIINGGGAAAIQATAANRGYWTIDGLDLRSSGAFFDGSSRAIYHNNWTSSGEGAIPGWIVQNCSFNTGIVLFGPNSVVRNNDFDGTGNASAIRSAICIRGEVSSGAIVEQNTISNFSNRGVWVMQASNDSIVRYNLIHDIALGDIGGWGSGIDFDGYGSPVKRPQCYGNTLYNCAGPGIWLENSLDHPKVYQNLVHDCLAGVTLMNYATNRSVAMNGEVHNNIIYRARYGISVYETNTWTFANNTITDGTGSYPKGLSIMSASTYVGAITWVNNIIGTGMSPAMSVPDNANIWAQLDYNNDIPVSGKLMERRSDWKYLTLGDLQALGLETHSITADPKFVDATNYDFHLTSASPCINAGATVSDVRDDYDNNARPSGTAYDIGAFEYQGGIAPAITTQPQSQTIQSGQTAALNVSAAGTGPITYQWYTGTSGDTTNPISGATSNSYTTPVLTQRTDYWVRVGNSFGNTDSNTAKISVLLPKFTISGNIKTGTGQAVQGVSLTFSGIQGTVTTDAISFYSLDVASGWSGTITPTLTNFTFTPSSRSLINVTAAQSGQDFTRLNNPVISGEAKIGTGTAVEGVTVTFLNGAGTATTDANGRYSITVSYGWSGTATPAKTGFSFLPSNRSYTNITANQSGQDYTRLNNPVIQTNVKNDFNGDGQDDILWRYYGSGGLNLVWEMGTGSSPAPALGSQAKDNGGMNLVGGQGPERIYRSPLEAGDLLSKRPARSYRSALQVGEKRETAAVYQAPWEVWGKRKGTKVLASPLEGTTQAQGVPSSLASIDGTAQSQMAPSIQASVPLYPVADTNWEIVGVGDFNADGKPDILWRNYGTPGWTGTNLVWYMNGTEIAGQDVLYSVTDPNWRIVGVGDLSGDGKPDIVWRNSATGMDMVWYMNGAVIAGQDVLYTVANPNWEIVGVGDFNGDGKPDILWRNYGTGMNVVWYMNGAVIAGQDVLYTVADTNWRIEGVGDYNGDGKADILWRNYGTAGWTGTNLVWYMNGAAIVGQDVLCPMADLNWRIVIH